MNATIEKLSKIEKRAQMIQAMRDTNKTKWEKTFEAAKNTPEWEVYCDSKGIVYDYNYGDVIC